MMKLFLVLACLGCSLLCMVAPHSASAQNTVAADVCEPYPNVPINVTTNFEEPQYDFTKNIQTIIGLARNHSTDYDNSVLGFSLGLARFQPYIDVNVATKTVNLPDGMTCARADHVDVTIGYKNITVYIASEVPQGSCGFNELLEHEREHIDLNHQLMDKYKPIIQTELEDYLKLNGVFREPNYDYAVSLIHDKVHDSMSRISDEFHQDNKNLYAQLDSREEIQRLNLACNGQLVTVIQNYQNAGW